MNTAALKEIAFAARATAKAARAKGVKGARLEALYKAEADAFRAFHASREAANLPSENKYGWAGSVLDASAVVCIAADFDNLGDKSHLDLSGVTL